MENITISGFGWAKRHKRMFDRIISAQDPNEHKNHRLEFHHRPEPEHLVIRFVDLDFPPVAPHDADPRLKMATAQDVERTLAFARHPGKLLVHCQAGVGRSSALGLAILADRLGPGREQLAMSELLRLRSIAVPNMHVVALADEVLGRSGRLMAAVLASDAERPLAQRRRRENRANLFGAFGLPRDL